MVSCESVEITDDKYACSELDWFEIGRSDGVQGIASTSYRDKTNHCEGFGELEHQKYVSGWYSGVDEFCTPSQGFAFGLSGQEYLNVCTKSKEAEFLKGYRKGLTVFTYEKDNQKITEELEEITLKAEEEKSQRSPATMKKLNELETKLELNKALIAEIRREMDDTRSQSKTF